jgi:GT2 family glycosyltransferase
MKRAAMERAAMNPPHLSVIIAAMSGCHYLERCLAALAAQANASPVEVIIVQGEGKDEDLDRAHQIATLVKEQYPWAQLIRRPAPVTLAQLRAAGIGCAAGEIIALTEDHCIPAADWCAALVNVHAAQPAAAIGGAVDNAAVPRLIDWAVYWCEYSPFASPLAEGPAAGLAAANVSYKRDALQRIGALAAVSYHEGAVHARLAAAGESIWCEPRLHVWHRKQFTLVSYCRERFAYSRWYSGAQRGGQSPLRRLLFLGAMPLLPFLLLLRLARRTQGRPAERRRFVAALPYLLIFSCVWAAGEAVGLLWGAGASEFELR